jgi:hypothetical protein
MTSIHVHLKNKSNYIANKREIFNQSYKRNKKKKKKKNIPHCSEGKEIHK